MRTQIILWPVITRKSLRHQFLHRLLLALVCCIGIVLAFTLTLARLLQARMAE